MNPYILRDGHMVWRKDPRVLIASLVPYAEDNAWVASCLLCTPPAKTTYSHSTRRDTAASMYQHFFAAHVRITPWGLDAS